MFTFATPFFLHRTRIRDPRSGIRDPGSEIRDNKYSDPDPGSGIKHPGSATLHHGNFFGLNNKFFVVLLVFLVDKDKCFII
jgi:hypothetical protein